ncbi:MAG: glycosyl transferase, partial [Gemmatimonadota bacterium]
LGWAILGGGGAVAAVGWIDDHGHVSPGLRLTVHAAAAGWALYWLGGVPSVALGSLELPLGAWGVLPGALVIVAVTNFYNFMDGIDGIAASGAVVACLAILVLAPGWTARPALPALLAGAALGFLAWNWEPAKIFMGDVGSGFLGFALGVMAFHSAAADGLPLVVTLGFLAVFLLDPTVTLLRRVLGRERWWTAHRKHGYQRAVRAGLSHRAVTTTVGALDAAFGLALYAGVERGRLLEAGLLVLAVFGGLYYALERASPMAVGDDP